MRYKALLSFLLVVLVVSSLHADVQVIDNDPQKFVVKNSKTIDPVLQQKIMFARQLVNERNYEGATSFLEVLYETEQDNQVIQNLLKQCYTQLKLHFKLEELLKKQMESNSTHIGYMLSLAEVTAQQGRTDEALSYYKKAEALISGTNRVRFQLLIQSMLTYNFESQAGEYINQWRQESGDKTLLGHQLGQIYERKKEYQKAMTEYYPLLADTARIGNSVEKEIVELLLFEDSAPIAEEYLLAQENLNLRAIKILSLHYIRNGQLDKSFAFTKLRDSLSEKDGNSLVSYMQTCQRKKLYDELIRMGEYLFTQYDNPAIQNRARFLIAEAYTNKNQFDKSLDTYKLIFESTLVARVKADALYYQGRIYQEHLHDFDSALVYYDSLIVSYKSGITYMNALAEVPYCHLQNGNLQKAKDSYASLEKLRLSLDIKEKVTFQIAQTLFIENNIDSCKTYLSKLLVNFPTGFYVNDALSLLKIIQTGEDAPFILKEYASALLFEIQKKSDSAIIIYDAIAKNETKVLADFALFRISETLLNQNDSSKALDYINQMEENFSDSYYFPYSLKQKADILITQDKKTDEAYEIYRHLLKEFPNYPFISEVRKILRTDSEEEIS